MLKPSSFLVRATILVLLLLSAFSLYLFVSDLLVRMADQRVQLYYEYLKVSSKPENQTEQFGRRVENSAKRALKAISYADYFYSLPEYFEVSGRFYFAYAMQKTNLKERMAYLEEARINWLKAHESRVLWPYYILPLLEVEIEMKKPKTDIQKRMSQLLNTGKNEASLLVFIQKIFIKSWILFTPEQQTWFINSLKNLDEKELRQRYLYARKVRNTGVICNFIAWNTAKKVCVSP